MPHERPGCGRYMPMKIIDLTTIIAARCIAGATDADTAEQQVVVLLQDFSMTPKKLTLELACEVVRVKAALQASKRGSGTGQ